MNASIPDAAPRIAWTKATDARDIADARTLFREYAATLGVDLCFQGFEAELAALPGNYAPPAGALLLVHVDDCLAACCAMRPLPKVAPEPACEMKRLYVRPAYRGLGLGRQLAQRIVEEAKARGYASMFLDTLETMHAARATYRAMGFITTAPYYRNPLPGVCYLRCDLRAESMAAPAQRD